MTESFRFIDLEINNAFENMAIDEAIMLSLKEGLVPPTLRIYRWNPSAVSIGTFQGMTEEVDVGFCESNGIDCIRRITGGGAVYHDFDGEVTYSIHVPKGHTLVPDDIIESYKTICSGIIEALQVLGIKSEFKPINDIVVEGKKISGNAQTRRHSCVLQHGTTLLNLDVERMFTILKVPQEKISDKMIADVKQRVTSIQDILGEGITINNLKNALQEGFSTALGLKLTKGTLTKKESHDASRLIEEKYSTKEWNFRR